MNTPALLTGLGCVAAAGLLLRIAKQELATRKQIARLTLTRIREIGPGLCLTAGEVVCSAPVQTPYSGTPAVWYRYEAWERRQRQDGSMQPDQALASGTQNCPFVLKDETGEIEIVPGGGTAISYAHEKVLKSRSGSRTPVGDRIRKLKDADRRKYPEGTKKPFFRKIEMEDEPLDIPGDLEELVPGSDEARRAHRRYMEKWIRPGDYVYLAGSATEGIGASLTICKPDKSSPLLVSLHQEDLTPEALGKNFMIASLAGLGLGAVGVLVCLLGLGFL